MMYTLTCSRSQGGRLLVSNKEPGYEGETGCLFSKTYDAIIYPVYLLDIGRYFHLFIDISCCSLKLGRYLSN